jgi:hypothetical protein
MFLNLARERRKGSNNWKDPYFPTNAKISFYRNYLWHVLFLTFHEELSDLINFEADEDEGKHKRARRAVVTC